MASEFRNQILRRQSTGIRKRSAKDDIWRFGALADAAAQAAAETGMVSPAGSSASLTQSANSATPPGQGSAAAGAVAGSRSAASPSNRAGLSNIATSAHQQQQHAPLTKDKIIETIQRHNYEINFVLRRNRDSGTRISLFEAKLLALIADPGTNDEHDTWNREGIKLYVRAIIEQQKLDRLSEAEIVRKQDMELAKRKKKLRELLASAAAGEEADSSSRNDQGNGRGKAAAPKRANMTASPLSGEKRDGDGDGNRDRERGNGRGRGSALATSITVTSRQSWY
jgi:hypothetical protein